MEALAKNDLRATFRAIINKIQPVDLLEQDQKGEIIQWIDSGLELCRLSQPATPDKHLVVYGLLVDQPKNRVLLTDLIKACLWLPTGGHVDPGEHPRNASAR